MGKIAALPYNLQSFYLSEPVINYTQKIRKEFCLKSTSKFINTLVELTTCDGNRMPCTQNLSNFSILHSLESSRAHFCKKYYCLLFSRDVTWHATNIAEVPKQVSRH